MTYRTFDQLKKFLREQDERCAAWKRVHASERALRKEEAGDRDPTRMRELHAELSSAMADVMPHGDLDAWEQELRQELAKRLGFDEDTAFVRRGAREIRFRFEFASGLSQVMPREDMDARAQELLHELAQRLGVDEESESVRQAALETRRIIEEHRARPR